MEEDKNPAHIWSRFNHELRSFIFSRVGNDYEADDILQEVYLKIHENIHSLRDNSRIRSWLFMVTRNLLIDHFRNKNRKPEKNELKNLFLEKTDQGRFMTQAINDMIKAMDTLPSEYCEALCLTEIEGISQKEYALRSGLSYSGAKSRVQRARHLLREMLLECCHYQFDKYGTVFGIQKKCLCCCG